MSESVIQGTPVQIVLYFVNAGLAPPPAPHPLDGANLALLLAQLPQPEQTALNTLLTTPLDQLIGQL